MQVKKNMSEDIIRSSGLPLAYKISDTIDVSSDNRLGEFVRAQVNPLTVFQKKLS